ncbi:MAG: caspase family protein [Planctomycetia bacterium]|nr:caspase family protein [Planctomycetia bacterium]
MRVATFFLVLAIGLGAAVGVRPADAEPAAPAWDPATTWAVLIGVLEWQDPALASFPKEGRVDRVLERTLLERGVPRAQVTFLEDRAATLAACRAAIDKAARAAGPGSTLLVYFAGHGLQRDGKVFFANVDADTSSPATTALGVEDLGATLRTTWKGARLLLAADCCHSGALGRVVAAYDGSNDVRAASFASAAASNVSTGAWTFTESLVACLGGDGGPDADFDRTVTFAETEAFVAREMRFRASQRSEARRTPSFEPGFALARVDPARARGRAKSAWQPGEYVEVEWKGTWWRAQVIDVDGSRPKVHYLGFDASWDEWVERARLRPPTPIAARAGDAVEIEWKGRFWPGVVLETADDFARVHYTDYGPEWDEWVTAKRLRAAPK